MKRATLLLMLLVGLASIVPAQTTPTDAKQTAVVMKLSNDDLHSLLNREDVRSDIALTTAQYSKIEAIKRETLAEASKIRTKERAGQAPEANEQLKALTEAQKAKIEAVLTPEQYKRLGEINIQLAGNLAAREPEIAAQLGITDEQKKEMDKVWEAHKAAVAATRKKIGSREMKVDDGFKEFQKLQQTYAENIGKILTPEQAAKLKEMSGKTFMPAPLPPTKPPTGGGL